MQSKFLFTKMLVICSFGLRKIQRRIRTCSGKVVHVGVEDEVLGGVEHGSPERGTLEAVLEHDGDALVDGLDALKDAIHVVEDPVGGVVRETGSGSERRQVIAGLVDGGDGEGVQVSALLGELEDLVNGLQAVVQVGLVVEPAVAHQTLTNVQVVDTAGEGVETDNDVHAVLLNGVLGDLAQVGELVTVVELGARDVNPGSIGCRDTQGVDADTCELVDGRLVEEVGVAGLESRAALVAKSTAESPLIRGLRGLAAERSPPDGIVGLLLLEPSSQVGTVGFEVSPVDEHVIGQDTLRPADLVRNFGSIVLDTLGDLERVHVLVVDGRTGIGSTGGTVVISDSQRASRQLVLGRGHSSSRTDEECAAEGGEMHLEGL